MNEDKGSSFYGSLSANLPSYDRSCEMQVAEDDLENIESIDIQQAITD